VSPISRSPAAFSPLLPQPLAPPDPFGGWFAAGVKSECARRWIAVRPSSPGGTEATGDRVSLLRRSVLPPGEEEALPPIQRDNDGGHDGGVLGSS
jgi:hypothetical protein